MSTALVVMACATTKPTAEWQDVGFSGSFGNLLVIGASDRPTTRRLFEDTFVQELAAIKVNAISSYKVMSQDQVVSRETVEAAIAGLEVDSVLVTRLLGVEEGVRYHPPTYYSHYRAYPSYYRHALDYTSPGYYTNYKILKIETNLYDIATQKLVWSMQSENIDPSTAQKIIEEQISLTIKALSGRGLISVKP